MAIASFDKDVEVIQKLDDEPNDVQGLTPEELKQKFDQAAIWLKEYINTVLLPGITGTGSTGGGSGASNIGAGVDDFPGSDVQAILNAFNDALTDRYTRAETNSYVGQETHDLVEAVGVDLTTGVITVTKKDGTAQTFDTALEKVPATMALVEEDGGTYLVITNQDGSQTRTDVSSLIDTYTFQNSTELSFSVDGTGNNRTVTATIRPASIGLDRFKAEVTEALEGYNAESAASASAARASETAAKASETAAKGSETAAAGSASTASQKASAAETSATSAAQSASAASASAQSAQSNASQALGAKGEAQAQAALAQSWAEGGTGVREGENTNNAKYWSDRAQDAAGGGVSSFNGRTGAVLPQSGDYTAQQVGAIPASQKGAAGGVAELDGSGKLTDAQKPGYTAADVGAASIGSNGQIPYSQTPHLTGNLTVYVDGTNGSDENSGAYGSPFKTIQAAVDSIPKNLGKYIATIRVADGNYEENIIISGFFGGCFVDYRILSLCVQADNVSDPGVVIKGKIDIVGNASSVSLNYLEIEGTDYACFTRNDVYLYQCKTTGGAHSIISWGGIFKAERCTFIAETYGFSTDTIALIANCTITSEKIGIACGSLGPASTAILVFSNCNITAPTKIGKYNHSIAFEDGVQV